MYSSTFTFIAGTFDAEFHELDAKIARAARAMAGYLGEESWESPGTGQVSTIYYWDSLESLRQLMDDPDHRLAKQLSPRWLQSYRVTIAEVLKTYGNLPPGFRQPAPQTPRLATLADAAEVARLFNDYRIFYEQPSDPALAARFIHERLTGRDSRIWVSYQGDQAVGFCQCYPSFCSVIAQPIHVLYDLYVAPAARKAGVGKALLLAAEQDARNQGVARLDLTTARTNTTAQRLYESLGWQRDAVFLSYNRIIGAADASVGVGEEQGFTANPVAGDRGLAGG